MSKEEILLLFSQIFVFLSILFTDFSRTGYHLKAKILEQGEKFFFVGTSPYKFRSSTPRGFSQNLFRSFTLPILPQQTLFHSLSQRHNFGTAFDTVFI